MLIDQGSVLSHLVDHRVENLWLILGYSVLNKLFLLEHVRDEAHSLEQLLSVDTCLPLCLETKRMHTKQHKTFVEKHLVDWVSEVVQHQSVFEVSIDHFRHVYPLIMAEVRV